MASAAQRRITSHDILNQTPSLAKYIGSSHNRYMGNIEALGKELFQSSCYNDSSIQCKEVIVQPPKKKVYPH